MATRVRNQPARQPGAPAARTGAGGRDTFASYSSGPPRRNTKKKKPAPPRNRPRQPPRKQARPRDAVVILTGWSGRVLEGAWMALAGAVGWAARSIAHGARHVARNHRRE